MIDVNDSHIEFALSAVRQAASLAGDIQQELVSKGLTKDDRSPVTVADFAAQAIVGYLWKRSFPGRSWLEKRMPISCVQRKRKRPWIK